MAGICNCWYLIGKLVSAAFEIERKTCQTHKMNTYLITQSNNNGFSPPKSEEDFGKEAK